MKTKFPREQAMAVALDLQAQLEPHCERIQIAGSLRRGKAAVSDIEIVYIPRIETCADPEALFGEIDINHFQIAVDAMLANGILAKRAKVDGSHTWGGEIKLAVHLDSGIPVDLFATKGDWWHGYLACRTGPKELNTLVCQRAIDRGLNWNPFRGCFTRQSGGDAVLIHHEADVFTTVGLECLPPEQRDQQAQAALA